MGFGSTVISVMGFIFALVCISLVIFVVIAVFTVKKNKQTTKSEHTAEEYLNFNELSNNQVKKNELVETSKNHASQKKKIRCQYCGSKFYAGNDKCPTCGARNND